MTTSASNQVHRHARMFALLRQKQVGGALAEQAAPIAARYLDDAAAMPMISSAVASLKAPAKPHVATGKPSVAQIFQTAGPLGSKEG